MDQLGILGRRFAVARVAADITQAEVANAVDLTRSSIANFEAGRQDVPISKVLGMCALVGVSIGDLAAGWPTVIPLEQMAALRGRSAALAAEMERIRARVADQDREIQRLARIADRRIASDRTHPLDAPTPSAGSVAP